MRRRRRALEQQDFGIDFTFFEVPLTMEGGYQGIDMLRAKHQDVTGVLCFSDVIADGALHRLNSLGISVPDDISIMGIEDLPASEVTFPALTSVRLSVEQMGFLSAEALISWLHTEMRPASVNLPVELASRASTSRPRN